MKTETLSIEQLFGYVNSGSDFARRLYKRGDLKGALKMMQEVTAKAEELKVALEIAEDN